MSMFFQEDFADAFCIYWLSPCDELVHCLPRVLILCEHLSMVDSDGKSWLIKVERNIRSRFLIFTAYSRFDNVSL